MAEAIETHGWWLASRASGLLALVLVTISSALALMVMGRMVRRPGLIALHRQLAVTALVAIAVHGITLLGDPWLRPGMVGSRCPSQWPTGPCGPAWGSSPVTSRRSSA